MSNFIFIGLLNGTRLQYAFHCWLVLWCSHCVQCTVQCTVYEGTEVHMAIRPIDSLNGSLVELFAGSHLLHMLYRPNAVHFAVATLMSTHYVFVVNNGTKKMPNRNFGMRNVYTNT